MITKQYIDKIVADLKAAGQFPEIRRGDTGFTFEAAWWLFEGVARAMVPGFRVTDGRAKAYAALAAWAANLPFKCKDPDSGVEVEGDPCRGLFVAGNPGSGKTTAVRIVQTMASQMNARFNWGTESSLLRWTDSTAAMICDHYAQQGTLSFFQSMKVISIQDLGSEPRETLYMGNRHEVMREFLELRGDTPGRFTIITSNYNLASIRKIYGDRVWSRLHRMCNYVELVGDDMRVGGNGS